MNLNRTNKSIKRGDLDLIEENANKKHTLIYSQFITSLYPLLEKENKNPDLEKIPHLGESHCLSFAHQTLSISSQFKKIQQKKIYCILGKKVLYKKNVKKRKPNLFANHV